MGKGEDSKGREEDGRRRKREERWGKRVRRKEDEEERIRGGGREGRRKGEGGRENKDVKNCPLSELFWERNELMLTSRLLTFSSCELFSWVHSYIRRAWSTNEAETG